MGNLIVDNMSNAGDLTNNITLAGIGNTRNNICTQTPRSFQRVSISNYTELIKFLLNTGIENCEEYSDLCLEIGYSNIEAVKILMLYEDVNTLYNVGVTHLHLAVQYNHVEIVKVLIEEGSDVNSIDIFGCSILYTAVTRGNLDIVKYLVEYGADVNYQQQLKGDTILHRAAFYRRIDIIKYLISHGAVLYIRNKHSKTFMDLLNLKQRYEINKYIWNLHRRRPSRL